MDLAYLKIKIDIKAEYEENKKKYIYKRKESKRDEAKKMFDGFKQFFKLDGQFKFKETDHSITAEYKEYGITLDMDIYKNIDNPDFVLEGIIKTYDKETYDFIAEGIPDKNVFEEPYITDEERMINDTRYFKEYLSGELTYSYRYSVKGRAESYGSMQELMLAI